MESFLRHAICKQSTCAIGDFVRSMSTHLLVYMFISRRYKLISHFHILIYPIQLPTDGSSGFGRFEKREGKAFTLADADYVVCHAPYNKVLFSLICL